MDEEKYVVFNPCDDYYDDDYRDDYDLFDEFYWDIEQELLEEGLEDDEDICNG